MYNHQFGIPNWSRVRNPYNYMDRGSQELIVTVGDSWTYGDSLGTTQVRNGIDDSNYRLAHVYGNLLTEQLGTDWINLALPGASNYCMLNWLGQLLDHKSAHSKITCIITLTESGRHEELCWATGNLLQTALKHMVIKTYSMVRELRLRYPRVVFQVAHNFTDSIAGHGVFEHTWLEVMTGQQLQNNTFIVVSEHIRQLNYNKTYPDTPAVIDQAMRRIDLLDSCEHCNPHDSRHPTEQGHRLWANYLATNL